MNKIGEKPDWFYLEAIKKSADGLFVLINDILDFSRIESGELIFEEISFNLEEILETISSALTFKIENKDIIFKYFIEPSVPVFFIGDPYRLNQILLNLINNAIKFTKRGKVEVFVGSTHLEENRSLINIKVIDTGIGIPKNKLSSLFDSFKQVDSSTTRKYGGTGLGLAICKKLTTLLKGTISVESKENEGTTFSISIPYETNQAIKSYKKNDLINVEKISDVRVLIAEDHPVNQILITTILDDWKIKYDLVENGLQAVQYANDNNYDIVLMDIQMPIMGGIEATTNLKQNPKNTNLPVVALTANAIKGDANFYTSKGMRDYLSKPFNLEELYKVFERNIV